MDLGAHGADPRAGARRPAARPSPSSRQVIAEVLDRPRDPAKLRVDVLAMRAEMAEHKAPRGPLDAKLAARGAWSISSSSLHYLQLRERTAFDPASRRRAIEALARGAASPDGARQAGA